MNICLETFGCRLNRAEALEDEARCLANGHRITTNHSHADMIVVRGCSVTGKAQRECERFIAHLKRKYPNTRLVITGCLAGAEKHFYPPGTKREASQPAPPPIPTSTARAYLKVQDGCSGNCTFCIVPKFRGKSSSMNFTDTLGKAKRFIESGYHEIVVTGCNLALYASEGKRLSDLVGALAELDPSCRIRLGSVEPGACAAEVVAVMAERTNVCRFLHIPVQSGSDRILKAMGRPYCCSDVISLAEAACKRIPLIGLGCDMMTGFPGETELDQSRSRNLLKHLPFSNVHTFPYSERPGTPAGTMRGTIPHEMRRLRARELSTVAQVSRKRFAKQFVGRTLEVIVESTHSIKGWTSEYLWFEGSGMTQRNSSTSLRRQAVKVLVKSITDDVLHGIAAP